MILFCVWSLMIAGEWYVAALAIQRCRKTYPWFTALVTFMALKSLVLFYIRLTMPAGAYFYPYYRSEFVVSFLQLGGTVEVFGTLFRPFWTVPKKSLTTLILCTSIGVALIARAVSVLSPTHQHGEVGFYRSMDALVSCSTALVLAAVFTFANYFEMPYRSRLRGIASGLCLMSTSSVVLSFVIPNLSQHSIIHLSFVPLLTHTVSLTIWIVAVERKESLTAVVGRDELEKLRLLKTQLKIALSNTPTTCALTMRKGMGKAGVEHKAKMVR